MGNLMRTMPKLVSLTLFAALVLAPLVPGTSHAFRSTKQESFTDPDYLDYRPKNVVLLVISGNFEAREIMEDRMVKELGKRGIRVYLQSELFPPTREWTAEAQHAIYEKYAIDSGIILTTGASSSAVIPIATQTYSSSNVFGNYNSGTGNLNAYGSGSSTTYNIVGAKSEAAFSAIMLDLAANRTVWYSDIFTKAGGTLFVSPKNDAKAAVKGLVNGLIEKGHIPKK